MSRRPVLLDTSFLVALERATAKGEQGPARGFWPTLRGRSLVVSIVSVEELLEGAADDAATLATLQRFSIQDCISRRRGSARCCSVVPRGEWARTTPGWLPRPSQSNVDIVGADRAAFERLGHRYLRFC